MSSRRVGPLSALGALLVFLATFALCLFGTAGVVLVVGLLILADVVVGLCKGDLKVRVRRPRW